MIAQAVPAHQVYTVSAVAQFAAIPFQRLQFPFFSFPSPPSRPPGQNLPLHQLCQCIQFYYHALSQVCDTINFI